MTSKFSAKGKLLSDWNKAYLKATDFDRWNHSSEAIEEYEGCAGTIQQELQIQTSLFTADQRKYLSKVCACLRLRSRTLQNMSQCHPVTLSDVERLKPLMKNFSTWRAPFPVTVGHVDTDGGSTASSAPSLNGSTDEDLLSYQNLHGRPLLRSLSPRAGHRRLTVRVISVGLKDASSLIQPSITVTIKDDVGISITPDQVVGAPLRTETTHIYFEQDVEIQRYIEQMYKGSAIFFEIRHCREKKRLLKTKCYSFLEAKSIKSGPISLRLLQKPVDYTKRRNSFLTKKPLYLNLYLTIHDE